MSVEVAKLQGRRVGLLVLGILSGCGHGDVAPPDTGARQCVQTFCEALIQQDWPKGYASLDPQSQRRCSQQHFSKLARNYRQKLGFVPDAVQVGICAERDKEATAHVVLRGRAPSHNRRYKEAIHLRRSDGGWGVELTRQFLPDR